MKKKAIILSMTHWDREHARPFEQFRWHLVYNVMDKLVDVLASGKLPWFTLDGQSSPVEDYLAIRPEQEEPIRRLVSEGKLLIGPLFTPPDDVLPSGEGLVRNLLLGKAIAERFGGSEMIGNNVDTFGRCAQMPQILRGFGIGRAVHARGVGDEVRGLGAPYRWRAPDGSEVLALMHYLQTTGALKEPEEEAVATLRGAVAAADSLDLPVVLIGNGGGSDGAPPQDRLPQLVDAFNEVSDDVEMSIGTLEDFFDAIEALDPAQWAVSEGEQRSGRHNVMLWGVPSARTYLKQANFAAERELFRYTEPMATMAWLLTGDEYPAPFTERALRFVLENHFHDTICGCSGDAVYHDVVRRYEHAMQICQILDERAAKRMAGVVKTQPPVEGANTLVVFNPLASGAGRYVCAKVYMPAEDDEPLAFQVLDSKGNAVASQVLEQKVRPTFQPYFWRRGLPYDKPVRELDVAFEATPPALGVAPYFVVPGDAPQASGTVSADEHHLENELVRVDIGGDGLIALTDKRSGHRFEGLCRFEDEESLCGEYYHVTAPVPDVRVAPSPKKVTVTRRGPLVASIAMEYDWALPVEAAADLHGRSAETVVCPMRVELSLWAGSPRVEIEVEFDNLARDHRLRVVFPTRLDTDGIDVESPFAVVRRPVDLPSGENWTDAPVPESPQQTFSDVSDGEVGLAVLNRGLTEIGVKRGADGVEMAVTLLRAVGWIARLHWAVAGYRIPTPEAQCAGKQRFEFALYPHAQDWLGGGVVAQTQDYAFPAVAYDPLPGKGTADSASLLAVTKGDLVVSSVKKAERCDDLVVRLWNAAPETVAAEVVFGFDVAEACVADMNEEPLEALPVAERKVSFAAGPHKIVTLRVKPA